MAKNSGAGRLLASVGLGVVAVIAALVYLPKLFKSVQASTGPAKPSVAGGQSGGAMPGQQKPSSPSTSSVPGFGSSQSAQQRQAAGAVAPKKGLLESVADALRLGNTNIPGYTLASVFNLQRYGNPFGDSMATTLDAFGLSSNRGGLEDVFLTDANSTGIDSVAGPSAWDFGSWFQDAPGNSWDYSSGGYSGDYTDLGLLDTQPIGTWDFGTWGQDTGGGWSDPGAGDTSGSYSGSWGDPGYIDGGGGGFYDGSSWDFGGWSQDTGGGTDYTDPAWESVSY